VRVSRPQTCMPPWMSSGLRGAMASALALQSVSDLQDLPENHGRLFLTSTLMTVAFTVLAMGGSTTYVLQWLQIELHVHQSSCVRKT